MLKKFITAIFCVSCASVSAANPAVGKNPQFIFDTVYKLENFHKGNLHNHVWSDHKHIGLPPKITDVEAVARWYKNNGYSFLAMTDHLYASSPGDYSYLEDEDFVILHGEEANVGKHMLAVCGQGTTIGDVDITIRQGVELIKADGATPILAHPHYSGLTADEIAGVSIMEILNAATGSSEKLWTQLLDRGDTVYGVAVDDNHGLGKSQPLGVAWVQVRVDELQPDNICSSLSAGRFYSSTGVELTRITVRSDRMYLVIAPQDSHQPADYSTEFIGNNNKILKTVTGLYPTYRLSDTDLGYVRAIVHGPAGTAWVQPVRIRE